MTKVPVTKVVVLGGGTAGWMTAAAFANHLPRDACQITLVESDAIGTVGVGESTIPHIRRFNEILGIDESEFMAATGATYKLGICFDDWGADGDSYIHPFGEIGRRVGGIDFHHYWLKARAQGNKEPLESYALTAVAARAGRFPSLIAEQNNQFSGYAYAYHIDATAYARFLRQYAERKGVKRREGKVVKVSQRSDGFVKSLLLESGEAIEGELFVDCTGFRAELMGKVHNVPFCDWSEWLPTDSACVVQTERSGPIYPMTRATARRAGWQWHIPLQHRAGNGHVYARDYVSDDEAISVLLGSVSEKTLNEPRVLRFKAGRRESSWYKNCVAVGLSSGFLEPLESTSIYLVQYGIFKLLELFPDKQFNAADTRAYNRALSQVYDTIRNFIILHYWANQKSDKPFWRRCQNMELPDSLRELIDQFSESGRVDMGQFGVWPAVCIGQHIVPQHYDARIDAMNAHGVQAFVDRCRKDVLRANEESPAVTDYISRLIQRAQR